MQKVMSFLAAFACLVLSSTALAGPLQEAQKQAQGIQGLFEDGEDVCPACKKKAALSGRTDEPAWRTYPIVLYHGYVEQEGKKAVVHFDYGVYRFAQGMGFTQIRGRYALVDTSRKTVLLPQEVTRVDMFTEFSDGLAAVRAGDKTGYIGTTGRWAIPPVWDFGDGFSEGLAGVRRGDDWFYINKTTTVISLAGWANYGGKFSEGLAYVCRGRQYGWIDKTGKLVLPIQYPTGGDFHNGLVLVEQNGKHGYMDKTGKVVIPFQYDRAEDFQNGQAQVGIDGALVHVIYLIDTKGRIIREVGRYPGKLLRKILPPPRH